MSDFLDRFIAAVSVLGLLVLLATAGTGGPVIDGECKQPQPVKRVLL
jgi:hypothetical protein